MSTPSSKKRPADDVGDLDEKPPVARPAAKRRRSYSVPSTEHLTQLDLDNPTKLKKPALGSGYSLGRLNDHVRLQDFGVELQKAADAVFPSGQTSRYTKVDVILLSWEDEEPDVRISSDLQDLSDTFANLFGYHVEEWLIPAEDSHNKLQVKILQFLWESNPSHLKIVFYGGHAKLASNGQPMLTRYLSTLPPFGQHLIPILVAGTARRSGAQPSSGPQSKTVLKNQDPMFWYSWIAVLLVCARPTKETALRK
jgi:hypothetical protein